MLSDEARRQMIAAEFLRVGASQQSWDQNFPDTPSTWVQGPSGPTLSPESEQAYIGIASPPTQSGFVDPWVGNADIVCPPGTTKEFVNGRWQCTASWDPNVLVGSAPDPNEFPDYGIPVQQPGTRPSSLQPSGALPPFVGGRMGKVVYTSIQNRNISGIRMGVLPRVIMGDVAPSGYASVKGFDDAAGDIGSGGGGLIEP